MDEQLIQIGERVKEARKLKRMTQVELAAKVNISSVFLSNIERGRKQMMIKTAIALSEVLNVTTDWLLKGVSHDEEQAIADEIAASLIECDNKDKDFMLRMNREIVKVLQDFNRKKTSQD